MPYKAKANNHQREIQPQCTKEQAQEPGYIAARARRLEEAKKLNLMSDVMASVVFRDAAACQHVLRILTGDRDLEVREVRTQHRISRVTSHDAVLDVLAEDGARRLYDLEVERPKTVDHPRRVRFYGAMMDGEFLEKGKPYAAMPVVCVIYLTQRDIWHMGAAVYRERRRLEPVGAGGRKVRKRTYDDGRHIIYVNAAVDDGSEAAKLMKYFMTADPDDMSQGDLSKRVRFLKCEEGGMEEMCEISEKWWREGLQEGMRRGERRGRRLARREYAKEMTLTLARKGMSVGEIAEAVKVSETSVRKWLTVS